MPRQSSASKIKLSSFDELFGVAGNAGESGEIVYVKLDELFEFQNHPFKVRDDEKMEELTESIREHGVLVPGIARKRPQGGYEMISGHSRKHACALAGLNEMPVFVRDIPDDEAVIVMVDSNIQRENILPSEKARAYRMKYDAIRHQGAKGNSLLEMGKEAGESAKTVQRYVWLGRLCDGLLEMLDRKQLTFGQAVDLSFLQKGEQEWVLQALKRIGMGITSDQASELKEAGRTGGLNEAGVWKILAPLPDRPKARKVVFRSKKLNEYFNEEYSEKEIEDIIIGLLEQWRQEKAQGTERSDYGK